MTKSVHEAQASSRRLPPAAIPADAPLGPGPAAGPCMERYGNCALPLPPLVLWMVSVTVSPSTDVTCSTITRHWALQKIHPCHAFITQSTAGLDRFYQHPSGSLAAAA